MSYKLSRTAGLIIRLIDSATIPSNDPKNADYATYLTWLAAGNVVQPADPDPIPIDLSDVNNLERGLKALALTFAQITNTPIATVRTIFKQKWDQLG